MEEYEFVKGFNHGYILAKNLPDLLNKLMVGLVQTSDYLSGLFSGKEEYELEYSQMKMNELNSLRNRSKDQERDLANDK